MGLYTKKLWRLLSTPNVLIIRQPNGLLTRINTGSWCTGYVYVEGNMCEESLGIGDSMQRCYHGCQDRVPDYLSRGESLRLISDLGVENMLLNHEQSQILGFVRRYYVLVAGTYPIGVGACETYVHAFSPEEAEIKICQQYDRDYPDYSPHFVTEILEN